MILQISSRDVYPHYDDQVSQILPQFRDDWLRMFLSTVFGVQVGWTWRQRCHETATSHGVMAEIVGSFHRHAALHDHRCWTATKDVPKRRPERCICPTVENLHMH